jgi:predicted transposase YdaD
MAGRWDSALKQLIGANPQHFISWLLRGARYIRELSAHLNRSIDIDLLYEVELNGERLGFHLELQRYRDAEMARRTWEYNVFASCKFNLTVVSFVIYLKENSSIIEPPLLRMLPDGWEIHRFNFINIKLWEIPSDELRQADLVGLLPLLPLTHEGATPGVVEEAINGIQRSTTDDKTKTGLLSLTFTLASLALDRQEDQDWLIRRFQMLQDILRDTSIYQLIMQEGVEKGREEGREEGLEEGRIQALRQTLLDFVQTRFPKLVRFASKQISDVTDVKTLQSLIHKIGLSQLTAEEARQLFIDLDNEDNS